MQRTIYTDRNGHTYDSIEELEDAVKFLEEDARFLDTQLERYSDDFMRSIVVNNAQNSRDYAQEIKSAMAAHGMGCATGPSNEPSYGVKS